MAWYVSLMRDPILRKHRKRILWTDPDKLFINLREEAIMWSEEEEHVDGDTQSFHPQKSFGESDRKLKKQTTK